MHINSPEDSMYQLVAVLFPFREEKLGFGGVVNLK